MNDMFVMDNYTNGVQNKFVMSIELYPCSVPNIIFVSIELYLRIDKEEINRGNKQYKDKYSKKNGEGWSRPMARMWP